MPNVAVPPEASPPDFFEEQVRSRSMFTFEGFAIGPMRIERYRRTALKDGREVTRIHVAEGQNDWFVSCLLELDGERVSRACSVAQDGAYGVLLLRGEGTAPLSGRLHAWVPMGLKGLKTNSTMLGTYTPVLVASDDSGPLGNVIAVGPWTKVRTSRRADADERSLIRLLGLLQASLSDPRDANLSDNAGADADGNAVIPPSDSYMLRLRQAEDPKPDPELLAALAELAAQLKHAKDERAARQVRRLRELERDQVFDEAAGALAQRSVLRGPVMELAGGPVWLPKSDGEQDGVPDGGRFHLAVGVRFHERTTVTFGMGMQFPAFSFEEIGEQLGAPAGRYESGAFNFDLTARHAFDFGLGGLEPLVGLSLRSRLAFLDYYHPTIPPVGDAESAVASFHTGLGVASIGGLQWGYDLNAIGSRFVIFTEFQPELMFWPVRSASDQSDATVPEAPAVIGLFREIGSEPTLQLGASAGIRLEL